MNFINSPTNALGLDISDNSVKAVQLVKKAGKINIRTHGSANLPTGVVTDGVIHDFNKLAEIIRKTIGNTRPKFNTKYAVLSLPETKTFIKVIEVPAKNKSARDIIIEELPKHVPVNLDEMRADWQEVKAKSKKRKFIVGMVPKKTANDYTEAARQAGLQVIALEVEAQAIARAIIRRENKKKINLWSKTVEQREMILEKPKLILDIGACRASLILLDENMIQFTDDIDSISDKKDEFIEKLSKKINQAENFYQTHFNKDTKGLEVLLCGGGSNIAGIDKKLQRATNRPVRLADILVNIDGNPPSEIRKKISIYATAIGLGLRNMI